MKQIKIFVKLEEESIELFQTENQKIIDLMNALKSKMFINQDKQFADYQICNMLGTQLQLEDEIKKVIVNPINQKHILKLKIRNNSNVKNDFEKEIQNKIARFILKVMKQVENNEIQIVQSMLFQDQRLNPNLKQAFKIAVSLKNCREFEAFQKSVNFIKQGQINSAYDLICQGNFRQSFTTSMGSLFQILNQQNDLYESIKNDSLFYKEVINKLKNGDKIIKDDIDKRFKNILQDKRKNVKDLIEKFNNLSQIRESKLSNLSNNSILSESCKNCDESKESFQQLFETHQSEIKSKKELQKKLQDQILKYNRAKSQVDDLNNQINDLNNQIQNLKAINISLEKVKDENQMLQHQNQNLKKQLQNITKLMKVKQNEIQKLKQVTEQMKIKQMNFEAKISKIVDNERSKILVDNLSSLQYLRSQFQLSNQFLNSIQTYLQKDIKEINCLYKWRKERHDNFHQFVDEHPCILLLCVTEQGNIIGGYSSKGWSLKQDCKEDKAFIFSINKKKKKMQIYSLIQNKIALPYDSDFIMFGNEEICIQRNTNQLSSYLVNGVKSQLHFKIQADDYDSRQFFLNDKADKMVKLKSYQVLELVLE